ncbi:MULTISPECIES: nitroreductase/quinone reductase family protein [unclassified Streptomyces]|uniref:nitroreductase/quinone reductase family protein n=1 Tax=unclassified Streptomyces TaxID=2593676 RepID=UPI002E19CF05|nr:MULTISPECIES: nitroreductase/quinone reductase family protein [unclassified Streptomyces]
MTTSTRPKVSGFLKFGNKMMGIFHGMGMPVGPMHLLRVKGRVSGREFTNPVAPVTVDGSMYILQAFPQSDWVKNVRAAGEGTLVRGRKAKAVRLIEVPAGERVPIAREFPTQVPMGAGIFVKNGVVADKTPAAFERAATGIPIFRVVPV